MLPKEQMDSIAAMIGIEADVLAQAISDEQEQNLELPKGRFLTVENEQKLIDNTSVKKYNEGKSKGSKEVIETTKTAFDLEGESIDDLLANYKSNILKEAKAEPNEKLAEKDKSIKALQDLVKQKELEVETFKTTIESTTRQAQALSNMPKLREDLGIKPKEALSIILSGVEQKEDGIYKNGKLLVDELQSAITMETFVKDETNARGWATKKIQGHGGKKGEATGSAPKSYSDFQKYCESKGWNEGGLEAKEYLKSVKVKNPDFDMDN